MATSATLYSPEVLALATSLSRCPWDESLPFKASARSPSCGSTLGLSLSLDQSGRIERLGLRSHACAIGQASAAIFAAAAAGRDRASIEHALTAISAWLAGDAPLPDWPGLDAIGAARDYPARHGAILLAWKAAADALPSA